MSQYVLTSSLEVPVSATIRQLEIRQQVTELQKRCRQGRCCDSLFQSVAEFLECLPLSTWEYGRAKSQLSNAQRYLIVDERGAAAYELRMLAGLLTHASFRGRNQRSTWNARRR